MSPGALGCHQVQTALELADALDATVLVEYPESDYARNNGGKGGSVGAQPLGPCRPPL